MFRRTFLGLAGGLIALPLSGPTGGHGQAAGPAPHTGVAFSAKRPVYVIAHRCNSVGDLDRALRAGANAIECDVRYGKPLLGRTGWYVDHDLCRPGSTKFDDWLNAAANAAKKYGPRFALVIFDIKTSRADHAGAIEEMHQRARARLPRDLNLLFSHGSWHGRAGFNEIRKHLTRYDGLAIDEHDGPRDVQDFFKNHMKVANYWYGNGIAAPLPGAKQERTVREAGVMRDRGEGIKKTYIWTLARESSIEVCVRDHKVDGVMVNTGTIGAAVRIVKKHARVATRADPAFAVHRQLAGPTVR